MTSLLALAPRDVESELVEPDVAFAETFDSVEQDRSRCPVSVYHVTYACWGTD